MVCLRTGGRKRCLLQFYRSNSNHSPDRQYWILEANERILSSPSPQNSHNLAQNSNDERDEVKGSMPRFFN
jgi:hypothetical protein